MKGTKIVCTMGPASESADVMRQMIKSGMDIARLNFSHGTHESHKEKIDLIRTLSEESGRPVAVLQDLCGPKIRVGEVRSEGARLSPGQDFVLTTDSVEGNDRRVSVSHKELPKDVKPGDRILLADGMMELLVSLVDGNDIHCNVVVGGVLTSHKGINLPTGTINVDSFTPKDKTDLLFGLENDVDFVAMSFVKTAREILNVKELIRRQGKDTPVIAKIEKHEALNNIEEIMAAADGIMVARGDLGVEIPLEMVPEVQKMLVKRANLAGKPVIIATQMLRSMIDSPRPTRAEATDVANAVLDGADAVMLSEETATGMYPVDAVKYMLKITSQAEKGYPHERHLQLAPEKAVPDSVAYASCVLADHLDAAAIVANTRTGFTAMKISRFRPRSKIIAFSPEPKTIRRLAIYWGCNPTLVGAPKDTDGLIDMAAEAALQTGEVREGDLIVITAGHPVGEQGTTKMLRVKKL